MQLYLICILLNKLCDKWGVLMYKLKSLRGDQSGLKHRQWTRSFIQAYDVASLQMSSIMSMDGSEPSARSPYSRSVKSPFAATFFRDTSARSARSDSNRSFRDAPLDSVAQDGGSIVESSTASVRQNTANIFNVFRNVSISERSRSSSDNASVDGSIHAGVEQIITRGRRQSYEEMAASLASSTPQQFLGFEGKAKIVVKIIFPPDAGRSSETKVMSLRALLLDILNEAQRYEDEATQTRHNPHTSHATTKSSALPTIYER